MTIASAAIAATTPWWRSCASTLRVPKRIPSSTYYDWYARWAEDGVDALADRSPRPGSVWNSISDDFSDFEFSNSSIVNAFFDAIEGLVRPTGRRWYFMTNFRDCRVWPEAWVAFAHRGRKVAANLALGTVRYAEGGPGDPSIFPSRGAALAEIERMKAAKAR